MIQLKLAKLNRLNCFKNEEMSPINFSKPFQLKIAILSLLLVSLFASCDRLDSIPYSPEHTPESWLEHQPHQPIKIGNLEFVLVQPSSSIIVYSLGIICLIFGISFLKQNQQQKSKKWWGIALILWGIGALLAGTSYQAFSYEIKCAGREICTWTSWWEVYYVIFSAASIDAMMLALVHTSISGKQKKIFTVYAISKTILYTSIVLLGGFIAQKFLISFELLLLVSIPSILAFLVINLKQYRKNKTIVEKKLLFTWVFLALVIGVYYIYLMLGFTEDLFQKGYWFSANDVLHLGLIAWFFYIGLALKPAIKDQTI